MHVYTTILIEDHVSLLFPWQEHNFLLWVGPHNDVDLEHTLCLYHYAIFKPLTIQNWGCGHLCSDVRIAACS